MKSEELRELDAGDLAEKLAESKEELFNLRFQNVTGQLDNHNRLGEVRRDIARIMTIMREREDAGEEVIEARPAAARPGRRRRLGRRQRSAK